MQHFINSRAWLLRIFLRTFLVVFCLNATVTNAVCCEQLNAPEQQQSEQNNRPCHEPVQDSAEPLQTSCCVACSIAMPLPVLSSNHALLNTSQSPVVMASFASRTVSPAFRPPISNLS